MNQPNWFYSEIEQVGVDYNDTDKVREYDSWMQMMRDVHKEAGEIMRLVGLGKGDTVLEVGTGTGSLAIEMSIHCSKVIAVDVSPAMLGYAKRKAQRMGRQNIDFYQAGFLTYEHHGNKVDVALSQLALHHLPDFWKMQALKRIYNLLKDGGKFYLRDMVFPSNILDDPKFIEGFLQGIRDSVNPRIAREFEIHIKEEYSTFDWIMENLLTKSGFTIDEVDDLGMLQAAYLCKKR